ncbi:glycosyltransferase family 4 protein [Halalkalirubrum salinum]|uniref:glycosyltransferase family 4 protein n=1 Tax=Halalkalirubrum salinum TaxID=2563889 RepID=UPI0010FB7A24|nr:glycosyltransferase family 4 protein [Halalkalirubrum salinum]
MSGNRGHVVFISQMYPPEKGGNASRIHDTARNLQEHGWSVTVVTPPPSYPPGEFAPTWRRTDTEVRDGVIVHRLWTWQPRTENPGMARRLPYYLLFGIHVMWWLLWNARRHDVVVTSTPPISTGAPGLVGSILGVPWIVDVRDLWIDASISLGYLRAGSRIERLSRRFQQKVLETADRISVTTPATAATIRDRYGESLGEKTLVLPNGVDTEQFQPAPESDGGTAVVDATDPADGSKVTATGERPVIVYTGNLGAAQDLESCIRAMAHLSRDDAVLRLVGSGDLESRLRALTDELGLEDCVEFAGTVDRAAIPHILATATIGIAPLADTEELAYAMPTKVYEYLACGLPTVTTGRGELKEFIKSSGGGIHVDNDPVAIARAFDDLLADDARRARMGTAGRQHVVEQYDRSAIAGQLAAELVDISGVSSQ